MTRFVLSLATVATLATVAAGCSSMNTGTTNGDEAERACLDTCEAIARAGERCGLEYKRRYDEVVRKSASGDCKNVVSIRDEASLRARCLPALRTEDCANVLNDQHDEACSKQLQRTASLVLPLFPAP